MVVICMGVAGSGKTTVGRALAEGLGLPFHDGDDFHPPANRAKMQRGEPLNDADRRPWLESLAEGIAAWNRSGGAVVACSALKQAYQEVLQRGAPGEIRFVYLKADYPTLRARLRRRSGHFFAPTLIPSQFRDLEEPFQAITVDARAPVEHLVEAIVLALIRFPPSPGGGP